MTQTGQEAVLFAPCKFQDGYNKIGPVHSLRVYSDSTLLIMATSQKISSHILYVSDKRLLTTLLAVRE
jgi:hypothetical protein